MASTKEFKDFILEQLDSVTCRYMMGEYVFYFDGKVFGGIYDDRFMVKKTPSNAKYSLDEGEPYPGGKPMYIVDNVDDREYLNELVKTTANDLKRK